jgi:hypothetical protein
MIIVRGSNRASVLSRLVPMLGRLWLSRRTVYDQRARSCGHRSERLPPVFAGSPDLGAGTVARLFPSLFRLGLGKAACHSREPCSFTVVKRGGVFYSVVLESISTE